MDTFNRFVILRDKGHSWEGVVPLELGRRIYLAILILALGGFLACVVITQLSRGSRTAGVFSLILFLLVFGLILAVLWRYSPGATITVHADRSHTVMRADEAGLQIRLQRWHPDSSHYRALRPEVVFLPWKAIGAVRIAQKWAFHFPSGGRLHETRLVGLWLRDRAAVPWPPLPPEAMERLFLGPGPDEGGHPVTFTYVESPDGTPLVVLPLPYRDDLRYPLSPEAFKPYLVRFLPPTTPVEIAQRLVLNYRQR